MGKNKRRKKSVEVEIARIDGRATFWSGVLQAGARVMCELFRALLG
ncbi:hypothetical protein ABMA10_00175 [Plantibacter sp. RU18]